MAVEKTVSPDKAGGAGALTGRMSAHVLHYRDGLTDVRNVHSIRVSDPQYSLLIMDDYAPVIGMVHGSVSILSDSGELVMEDVAGFYRLLKNEFTILVQPGASEERVALGAAKPKTEIFPERRAAEEAIDEEAAEQAAEREAAAAEEAVDEEAAEQAAGDQPEKSDEEISLE
ncbi:MAG: hypothetical protein LBK23_08560 [Oscillospiraceae bacterium]|jgi:hypothetical protein|nr:hypothetical protein [Oscillospiraceae bacterium]